MNKKLRTLWVLAVLFYSTAPVFANSQQDSLIFLVYFRSIEPYAFYNADNQKFDGIVPAILGEAARRANRDVRFEFEERKRAEQRVYTHKADGLILSKEWALKPDQLLFSNPLFVHRSYLLSRTNFEPDSTLKEWVKGKTICTRVNYIYPELARYFDNQIAFRHDLSSHSEMMKLLANKRCDLAYMSEYRALWQLVNYKPEQRLFFSPRPVEEVAFTIALSDNNEEFLSTLNQYIKELHDLQKIDRLITEKLLPY